METPQNFKERERKLQYAERKLDEMILAAKTETYEVSSPSLFRSEVEQRTFSFLGDGVRNLSRRKEKKKPSLSSGDVGIR